MANLYYREDLTPDAFRTDELIDVEGNEARHAVRVARLRESEHILIGNAAGVIADAVVTSVQRERFRVRLREVRRDPHPLRPISLVQALAKGDRDERAVEQATEFGVDFIVPWQAERSVSRWESAAKAQKGREKWQRIAREASKQSLRSRVPSVYSGGLDLAQLIAFAEAGARVLVLDPRASQSLSEYAREELPLFMGGAGVAAMQAAPAAAMTESSEPAEATQPADAIGALGEATPAGPETGVLVVIGPEGGVSERELSALQEAGGVALRLGETVLRTSSAGPAALAVLNAALGRW